MSKSYTPPKAPSSLRGRLLNALFTTLLAVICLVCYALLIILYVQAHLYHIPSLVNDGDTGSIKPTVAVGLIAAMLAAATSALITRCVEHSFWLKLVPGNVGSPLTVGEITRLAQWSVSPLSKLTYAFNGRSWAIKTSGLLLLSISIITPVLLAGISQTDHVKITSTSASHAVDYWAPWINRGNFRSRGGSAGDLVFGMAVQASNGNFAAPVAPVCDDDSCSVSTGSSALFATCNARTIDNTENRGLTVCPEQITTSTVASDLSTDFCSDIVPSMCVNLTCGAPSIYANFKTGLDLDCESGSAGSTGPNACIDSPGSWAVIFGAWVGGADFGIGNSKLINTVSCLIEYGNISISQTGKNPPRVERNSFKRSIYPLSNYNSPISNVRTFIWNENARTTPYYFTLRVVGTGWNDMYQQPFAAGLLGDDASNNAEHVARQIENNFDWATMGAFARMPNASDVATSTRTSTRAYVYNQLVLLILLVPFLGSLLGTWGRWVVGSNDEVLGYDPAAIANRGPVEGIASKSPSQSQEEYKKARDKLLLIGVEESLVNTSTRDNAGRIRFLARQ
ncbi:hypothetical protein V499_06633 [Pseudogymnoascus sp. VKM F-103]|uniref:Uncharacterized protein n=1 Tax=Pseudogymnoascus verrucosus TaxID=342668 RepID=A0A1B8GTZ7_9PEZI|nr:uncharacterized protein VE01_02658 [Pseudogymnoascus verrucosus]KFY73291.1 hypothetical protein V499_06633 [Pseudogymnoascus sp. VKM F-103]OBT99314.1 hypothetical protein VE01_02658 [Pseudogymnoascus verrucosus]